MEAVVFLSYATTWTTIWMKFDFEIFDHRNISKSTAKNLNLKNQNRTRNRCQKIIDFNITQKHIFTALKVPTWCGRVISLANEFSFTKKIWRRTNNQNKFETNCISGNRHVLFVYDDSFWFVFDLWGTSRRPTMSRWWQS